MKFFITLLILSLILSSAYAQGTNQVIPNPEGLYNNIPVKRVITGDTIELVNGEVVRLIGIDCPEMDTEEGKKAKEFVEDMVRRLATPEVFLEFDAQQRDKYGRLLAYVFVDTGFRKGGPLSITLPENWHADYFGERYCIFINATIIKSGYAKPFFTPPNVKYAKLFEELYQGEKEKYSRLHKSIGGPSQVADPHPFNDVDSDGDCDSDDIKMFNNVLGECERTDGRGHYNSIADADHNGCVTGEDSKLLFPCKDNKRGRGKQYELYVIDRVLDAATLKLTSGEVVRLIGIDPVDINPEAAEFVRGLFKKTSAVRLKFDVSEGAQSKDSEGRMLVYVYLMNFLDDEMEINFFNSEGYVFIGRTPADGTYPPSELFLNATLIHMGYARHKPTSPYTMYASWFEELAESAKEHKRGLWKESGIPLGPESEKFFYGVVERLQNQPASKEPMRSEK